MNHYIIIGNLVRDPETGATESGINWCRFTVAARKKRPKEGQPDAEFVRVTAWRGLGDTCAKYLRKGRKVCVIGEPVAHAWIGNDGAAKGQIEMNADEVEFLSSGQGGAQGEPTDADAPPERGAAAAPAVDPETGMTQVEDPEDLPF
jgi:single-strand DNA-binding protein